MTKKKGFRLWIMIERLIKPYGIYVRTFALVSISLSPLRSKHTMFHTLKKKGNKAFNEMSVSDH